MGTCRVHARRTQVYRSGTTNHLPPPGQIEPPRRVRARLRDSIRPIRSHLRSQRIFRSLRSPVRERDRTCVLGSRDRLTLLAATAAFFFGGTLQRTRLARAADHQHHTKCGVFFFSAANRPKSESRSRACTTSTPFLTAPPNPNLLTLLRVDTVVLLDLPLTEINWNCA
ncbi:hypothetical protein [Oryza sativa Japonica Group]|uniref:Uncharacterized protein n=1 Tax=Oryza sativa subsp. japonica TaxID=39947 RepID=Q5JK53_ORYSJ|nr:hypothetical protein [Oryza sativa Japonica Group]